LSAPLRRVVLDILKPIKGPSIIDVSKEIASLPGVDGVNITVKEIDVETVTLTMTIEGSDIDFEVVEKKLEELGCIIHSVDQAVAGKKIVNVEDIDQGE
jgi:hypothetical protein